jgi:hypothetical protein
MRRIFIVLGVISVVGLTTRTPAADVTTHGHEGTVSPAVSAMRVRCSGFISDPIPRNIEVFNGSDNDLFEVFQQFTQSHDVYLRSLHGEVMRVGDKYDLIRRDTAPFGQVAWMPDYLQAQILPPQSLFYRQRSRIRNLGQPYLNTGTVQVIHVAPQGAVAKVINVCGAINIGDIAVPYHPVSVPTFTPNPNFRRFAEPNGKLEGNIVAANNAENYLALGDICYLDIGRNRSVSTGQVYRAYAKLRDHIVEGWEGIHPRPATPREYVGEVLILSVQHKSSVGLVVREVREIAVGDGVELEQ